MPEREALGTPKAGTKLRPIAGRIGWLRTVLLPVCVLAVLSSSSYAYENRPLAAEGAAYEEEIKARVRDDREKLSPEDLEMLKTLVGPILPLPSPLPSVGKGSRFFSRNGFRRPRGRGVISKPSGFAVRDTGGNRNPGRRPIDTAKKFIKPVRKES